MLARLAPGITPEMAAAVSKIMRVQDLILVARKCRVVTRFRNTIGLAGRLSTRLQPNDPTDDPTGIAASILDGLLYGSGDAVIGVNPASDSTAAVDRLLAMLDQIIQTLRDPDPVLRPDAHHDDDRRDRARRAGRSRLPVDRRDRGSQPQLRHQPRAAPGGARGGAAR